jgi:hypothetical protein
MVQNLLPIMTKGWMAKVMGQAHRLDQIGVSTQVKRDPLGNLCHL